MSEQASAAVDQHLSITETAQRLSVSNDSVRRWIKSGEIEAVQLSARIWRVPESALAAFLEARSMK